MLHCPTCHIPIASLNHAGQSKAACVKCHYQFEAITGSLHSKRSREVVLRKDSSKQTSTSERHYEFTLLLNKAETRHVTCVRPGETDELQANPGDMLTLLFTSKDGATDEWISFKNHSTGNLVEIATPGKKVEETARNHAGPVFLIADFCLLFILDVDLLPATLIALAASAVYCYGYIYLKRPKRSLNLQQQETSADLQKMLLQKAKLLEKRHQLAIQMAQRTANSDRLQATQSKMLSVDKALYASRLETIETAIAELEKLQATEQALCESYDKAIDMLDIEIDSLEFSSTLSVDVFTNLEARLLDIQAMEQLDQELRLHLEANEEVAALLK